ncbi:MAG: type II toxin-antitoxin system PemK/MazF family toxin [Coriobacteriia bacterium]|nr:type II toxin-antitoxin system PemK/MazF family toxin [Coriobacteriia bacterium]MCL2750669.1 type II toxin-antitoxin system PemK/MazF family toxin [Coriobacteriia bacterium]
MVYEQGDIVFIDFSPSKGHEPMYHHPALVVSSTRVNYLTNLTLLAPITSTDNRFPLHVPIKLGNAVEGFVQCEALRALDLQSRKGTKRVGAVDDDTLSAVLEALGVVLGI